MLNRKGGNRTVHQVQDVSFIAGPKTAALLHMTAQTAERVRDNCGAPILLVSPNEYTYLFFH